MPDEEYHLRPHIEIVCCQEVSSTPRSNAGVFRSILLYEYRNTRLAPGQYKIHSHRTARGSSRPSGLNNSTIQYSYTAAIPLQRRFNSMSPSDSTDAWKLSLLFTLPRRALRYPARSRATRLCLCKGFVQGRETAFQATLTIIALCGLAQAMYRKSTNRCHVERITFGGVGAAHGTVAYSCLTTPHGCTNTNTRQNQIGLANRNPTNSFAHPFKVYSGVAKTIGSPLHSRRMRSHARHRVVHRQST